MIQLLRPTCFKVGRQLPVPKLAFGRLPLRLLSSSSPGEPEEPSTKPGNDNVIKEEIYGRQRIYAEGGSVKWKWNDNVKSFAITGYLTSYLTSMFLPVNFPTSVHRCYVKFHAWQAVETYIGATVGVLCSQAMLASLGLATTSSVAGAVAVQWVLKDGIAEIGKLLFIKQYAQSFDSHPKTWKAIGEIANTLGSGLQLCTALVAPEYFLLMAAGGNILKSTSWALWGATHMWFTKNFANYGNVGDLTAKSDAQSAFAQIAGWISGVLLISASHDPAFLFGIYFLMAPMHALCTRNILRNAEFEVLNEAKSVCLTREFVKHGKILSTKDKMVDLGLFGEYLKSSASETMPRVKFGCSIEEAFDTVEEVRQCIELVRDENYVFSFRSITPSPSSKIGIVFHREAEGLDVLKALCQTLKFHSMLVERDHNFKEHDGNYQETMHDELTFELVRKSHQWTLEHFPAFIAKLDGADWITDTVSFNDPGYRALWTKLPRLDVVQLSQVLETPAILVNTAFPTGPNSPTTTPVKPTAPIK